MNPSPPWPRRGLYLLTPDELDTAQLLARTGVALAAGVSMLQYRNKVAGVALRREQATALLALCRQRQVPLIVNDDWQLAADIGADGAHLGSDDGELREARKTLGVSAIIGASCYNDFARAERATASGASYLAFGAFFPSATKPLARRADIALLRDAACLGLPKVAIGGITADNAGSLICAGTDMIAVIGAVFDAHDPAVAVRALQLCFDTTFDRAADENRD